MMRYWMIDRTPEERAQLAARWSLILEQRERLKVNMAAILDDGISGYQQVTMSKKTHGSDVLCDALLWCRDNFGSSDEWENSRLRWFTLQDRFYFVDEEDCIMFKMVWM